MDGQVVMLTWHQFSNNLQKAADVMRNRQHFTDVTLAAEDRQIEAHRFILASSSSFFMNLLYKNPSTSLIYLAGVKFRDLVSILDFMYCGKVRMEQSRLQKFLAVAGELGVKGLAEDTMSQDNQKSGEPVANPAGSNTENGGDRSDYCADSSMEYEQQTQLDTSHVTLVDPRDRILLFNIFQVS